MYGLGLGLAQGGSGLGIHIGFFFVFPIGPANLRHSLCGKVVDIF